MLNNVKEPPFVGGPKFLTDYDLIILCGIPRGLLRGFCALAKSVSEGAKFRNTPSACGGDRNFEDFACLFEVLHIDEEWRI